MTYACATRRQHIVVNNVSKAIVLILLFLWSITSTCIITNVNTVIGNNACSYSGPFRKMNSVNIKIKLFVGFLLFNSFLENQSSVPQSRLPPMVPNFVGREIECEKIIISLTSESTRHVNIHGSPRFGKSSTAISIGHRLQSKGQPVYFFTFRGINSKSEFISKLLSIFKRSVSSRLTPVDELCSFLENISCRFSSLFLIILMIFLHAVRLTIMQRHLLEMMY